MPNTPVFALPYPTLSDTADVPRDIQALATRLDALALVPAVVSALPGSPFDGQEVYYAADPANGVYWHLRYRSGATGSYKWEFVGGPPLAAESIALTSLTAAAAGIWGAMAAPISITLPLGGDYDLTHVGNWRNNNASTLFQLGERLAGTDPATGEYSVQTTPSAGAWTAITHRRRIAGRAAASTVAEVFQTSAVGDIARTAGRLDVVPVRVG